MPHLKGHNGFNWHYDIDGEGENLVFLHGWGVDKRIWRQQSKYFLKFYKVTTIDLPGHGQTNWQNKPLKDMTSDLSKVLVQLLNGKMTIISSSLGGLFALKIYEGIPEKIERLVFVGSMPKFAQSDDYPYGLDVKQMRKLSQNLDEAYPVMIDIFFRSLFTQQERQTRRFKWMERFRQTNEKPMKQALVEYLDILEQEDLRDILTSITLPMQFINGTGDEICDQATVAYLKKLVPHARFDDFQDCGHFPFLSKSYEFNEVLEDFLKNGSS